MDGGLPTSALRARLSRLVQDLERATVGGNLCMSLPAGPMVTLATALEARYTFRPETAPREVVALHGVVNLEPEVAGEDACGRNLRNPLAEAIVTGKARYTLDVPAEGALHLKVLRAPDPHARIKSTHSW